jgi:beta-phosphoglucomutase-like phosphatase (HAD superfamily)
MNEPLIPTTRNIQGIIFDCDGTLADSMPLHWQAWQAITLRHQLHFPEDRFYSLGGVPSRDILKVLGQEQNIPIDPLAVAKEKENEYLKLLEHVNPIHEVVEIARSHHGSLPMAVASGGIKSIIERVLVHLGIRDLFQAVVTSEDVANQKPAPDIFIEAARRIEIAPENCRAYEDTDIGLQAIRSAHMEAVDVRTLRPVA